MHKGFFLAIVCVFGLTNLIGQNTIWTTIKKEQIKERKNKRVHRPVNKANYLDLDYESLLASLKKAPVHTKEDAKNKYMEFELPMPDGTTEKFHIQEKSIMDKILAAEFPFIKTYSGVGIDDPTARIKLTTGLDGFHAQILSARRSSIYIDPYFFQDKKYYISFHKKDLELPLQKFRCQFDEYNDIADLPIHNAKVTGDCSFRDYRLAVAATGEYTTFHGGTVAQGMSAINTTMARVNGIYELEIAVTMTLVANNSSVVYTNASTDPYNNNSAGQMLGQNQTNLDNVIGSANYDVGHVFSTGGGGVASLNAPCVNSRKARGVSGLGSPVNDPFDVDYVAHEIGHQFGATHTFNNSCGGNRTNSTAYEPGSGSTIMAYAGICNPNVQNNSDDFFHAASLEQMKAYVQGGGNSCPTVTSTSNSSPTITNITNKTIPISTPFFIEATATDPNGGDILTYAFQQWDNETGSPMPPQGTSTTGPLFRANKYTESNRRYFPSIIDVKNGTSSTWEVLPDVARTMDFRATVRDLAAVGGCTDEDNVLITTSASSGPFVVTSQSSPVQWPIGSTQTVTWNVAGTNSSPVSCSTVDILLSKDDGFTYPVTIASNLSNSGSATITIPNEQTDIGRIMVVCSNNFFYNLNTARIGIGVPPLPEYCSATYGNSSCGSGDYIDDVTFNTISNVDSGCALSGNYSDFTAQSTTVEPGSMHTITVGVTPDFPQYVIVGIDFNIDGDFADSGEFFTVGTIASGSSANANIAIPNSALVGNTRMRVMSEWDGTGTIGQADLCGSLDYGEYEDYTIVIDNPCESFAGKLFDDLNNNGCEDNGEPGVSGQTVSIFECDAQGNKIMPALGSDVTDAMGEYKFGSSETGSANVCINESTSYLVAFETIPTGYFFSRNATCLGTPEANDVDRISGESNCIIGNAQENDHINAGIVFCPDNQTIDTDFSGDRLHLEVGIQITADNMVENNAQITYDAGTTICLENDFYVDQSSNFDAIIDGCGNLFREENETDSK